MRYSRWAAAAAVAVMAACSQPAKPPAASPTATPLKITQFYATTPKLAKGERGLLCYGVDGAKSVWLEPPRQELSAALSRCVEVKPAETTRYVLTAADASGKTVTQEVTVTVGAPRVKIVEVRVDSLDVPRGAQVKICYVVENARAVQIEPIRYRAGASPKGCATVQPDRTTTYTVTATGTEGEHDEERVTIKTH